MRFMRSAALCFTAAIAVAASAGPVFSATTLQREYRFGPDRVTVERKGDETQVRVLGGIADVRPGRPDLPWVSETVQLPAGQRLARVEVVSVETEHVASGVSIPTTVSVGHGQLDAKRILVCLLDVERRVARRCVNAHRLIDQTGYAVEADESTIERGEIGGSHMHVLSFSDMMRPLSRRTPRGMTRLLPAVGTPLRGLA